MSTNISKTKTAPTGRFRKGTSGNPGGRPPGSRNRAALLMESLFEEESERLTRKAIRMALNGDSHAMRLCMERLYPPRKDRPIDLRLPPTQNVEQLSSALSTVVQAIGDGQITPTEGEKLATILSMQQDVMGGADLDRRFEAIEKVLFPTKEDEEAREKAISEAIVHALEDGRMRMAQRQRERENPGLEGKETNELT